MPRTKGDQGAEAKMQDESTKKEKKKTAGEEEQEEGGVCDTAQEKLLFDHREV